MHLNLLLEEIGIDHLLQIESNFILFFIRKNNFIQLQGNRINYLIGTFTNSVQKHE